MEISSAGWCKHADWIQRAMPIPTGHDQTNSEAVAFIPGLFETPEIWEPVDRWFGHRPVLHLDLPGHTPGDTELLQQQDPVPQSWFDRTLDRIDEHGRGRPVHLVAHSSGAMVSLILAVRRPEVIGSLVLVGAPLTGHRDRASDAAAEWLACDTRGALVLPWLWRLALSSRWCFEKALGTVTAPPASRDVPEAMRRKLAGCDPEAVRQFAKWVLDQDLGKLAEKVTQPCLLVVGKQDHVVPPSHQMRLLRQLPQSQAHIVNGGHLPFLEQPAEFRRLLFGWLAEQGGTVRD